MNELDAVAILLQTPYLGPVKFKFLMERYGSATKVLQIEKEELLSLPGFGQKIADHWKKDFVFEKAYTEIALCQKEGVSLISFSCPNYPKALKHLNDAPMLLYVKGELKEQDEDSIAVIGTRNATRYGLTTAATLTKELCFHGFTIISGLARGIDTVAHQNALNCNGRTIAVIGSGLLNLYPRENNGLADKIAKNGAVISEFTMKTPPDKQNFPKRNRIVSGLSLGSLLIEAPIDSGAIITMELAKKQNKRLFAVPGPIDYPSFEGNHLLLKNGQASFVQKGADVASYFERKATIKNTEAVNSKRFILNSEEENLLNILPESPVFFDEIIALSAFKAVKLNVLLMGLVLKGAISEHPGKIYKKSI